MLQLTLVKKIAKYLFFGKKNKKDERKIFAHPVYKARFQQNGVSHMHLCYLKKS